MRRKKKWLLMGVMTGLCALVMLAAFGCSPQPGKTEGEKPVAKPDATPPVVSLAPQTDPYNPIVKTLPDGTRIQRTPTEDGTVTTTLDGSYTYHTPATNIPYNTYYLNADAKGCYACHEDLANTLNNMEYSHTDLSNALGIQITVQMCIDCHTFGYGYLTNQYSFGSLVHGIHEKDDRADCWNCHVGTGSGEGMQLWDEAKYRQLRGITPISDVQGDFSYDQDKLISAEELFDFGWDYFDLDYMRTENNANNTPLDQEMFDTWTITVSGAVAQERTYTLPELIEKFPSKTVPFTLQCTLNPIGGPFIGNTKITGIPLSALFADAGISPTAGAFTAIAPDGFTESMVMGNFTEGYITYEMDGAPLMWKHGYPVTLYVPGSAAPISVKEVSEIIVNTQDEAAELHEWNGWPQESGDGNFYTPSGWPYTDENDYVNKPNVGLFDFTEGTVITTGKPYTFTGYASGWDETIGALEFSMDGGTTWTRFDTPQVDKARWVIWHFAFTPEVDSGYVLSVRAVSTNGHVTQDPIEVLFNAKAS